MKITVEHYIETITVEVPEEATATDFANLMYRLSLMVGYNEKNVVDAFAELGETHFTHNEPVADTERLDFLLNHAYVIELNNPHNILSSREKIDSTMDWEKIDITMDSQEP